MGTPTPDENRAENVAPEAELKGGSVRSFFIAAFAVVLVALVASALWLQYIGDAPDGSKFQPGDCVSIEQSILNTQDTIELTKRLADGAHSYDERVKYEQKVAAEQAELDGYRRLSVVSNC